MSEEKTVPTDLHPRPLGPNRAAKPVAAGAKEEASAASALWANPLVRTSGSLLVVLVLIFALATVAKKVSAKGGGLMGAVGPGGKAPAGLLEVLGRYPLARGQTLILMKLDSRVLLLSQTTPRIRGGVGTLTTLCEIRDPEEVASILVKAGDHEGGTSSAKFSALLHAFDRTHAKGGGAVQAEDEFTEVDLRHVQEAEEEDGAEMWDERAMAPVVHKFPTPQMAPQTYAQVDQRRVVNAYVRNQPAVMQVDSLAPTGTESFGSIRQRLSALRGEAHR